MADSSNLPASVKGGVAGVGAGATIMLGMFFRHDLEVLVILVAGILAVIIVLLVYVWFLRRLEKGRSKEMGETMRAGARRKPREISSPEALAKISDLQSKFEEGVEKFRAAGKDLYSLPWFLLVGEPGSGKTEAIRHCNVGFPPGLQAEQQGVGGTVNMNWWFTNHAIILDTAGRLMFDQVEAAATGEWKEFLKLLLKARPNCPVNGLLLVIPADSLIIDTADKIESKAGKIARQLDTIQRTLGVRFPVFVVITKSDKINGFREFFDALADPRLQHQMMGWSNSDPLDARFEPDEVEAYLNEVSKRLARRRLGLLLDPVHSGDPDERRIDEVDALYALPDSMTVVGPRLRRYLEMIFVAGEWSPKPLFLRGIYFTSSMREGSALDKDLADLLGVPVESLPDGRVWEKDRAFFLRDLFMNKVFREKGLVTRAVSAGRLQRGRKLIGLSVGFAAVVILGVMSFLGVTQLRDSVGRRADYWTGLRSAYGDPNSGNDSLSLIRTAPGFIASRQDVHSAMFQYEGDEPVQVNDRTNRLADLFTSAENEVRAPLSVPPAFFWAKLAPDFERHEREAAVKLLFEATVIRPIVNAVRLKLSQPATIEDPITAARTVDVMQQLLQLDVSSHNNAVSVPASGSTASGISLDPMLRYVLSDEDYKRCTADLPNLQETCDHYFPPVEHVVHLEPDLIEFGTTAATAPLLDGIDCLGKYWLGQFGDEHSNRVTLQLVNDLQQFDELESAVGRALGFAAPDAPPPGPATSAQYAALEAAVKPPLQALADKRRTIDRLLQQPGFTAAWQTMSLASAYFDDKKIAAAGVSSEIQTLHDACDSANSADPDLNAVRNRLKALLAQVNDAKAGNSDKSSLKAKLDALDLAYFKPNAANQHLYQVLGDVYQTEADEVSKQPADSPKKNAAELGSLDDRVQADAANASQRLSTLLEPLPDSATRARIFCTFMVQKMAVPRHLGQLISQVLNGPGALSSSDSLGSYVGRLCNGKAAAMAQMPMTAPVDLDPRYDSSSAKALFAKWSILGKRLNPDDDLAKSQSVLDSVQLLKTYADRDSIVQNYRSEYQNYWQKVLQNRFEVVRSVKPWSNLANVLPGDDASDAAQKIFTDVATALGDSKSNVDTAILMSDRNRAASVSKSWRDCALETDASARTLILGVGPSAVARDYMILDESQNVYHTYWSHVTLSCLRTLADASEGASKADNDRLWNKYYVFPLAPPSPTRQAVLSAQEISDAVSEISKGDGDASADDELKSIPNVDFVNDYRNIQLTGDSVRLNLDRIKDLADVLTKANQNKAILSCSIHTVALPTQQLYLPVSDTGSTVGILYGEALLTDVPLAAPTTLYPAMTSGKDHQVGEIVVRGTVHDTFKVRITSRDGTASDVVFQGPWAALRAMYQNVSVKDNPSIAGSKDWYIPLKPDGVNAVGCLRFNIINGPKALPGQ